MPAEDVTFTFDTKQILNGFKQISKSLSNMGDSMGSFTSSVNKGVTKAMTKVGLVFAAIKKGIAVINQHMPEVGKTFSIAGDIMWKNLLWPLRQFLMPMLQDLLNWTRENRSTFVKWGQAIVSGLKMAINLVKKFINLIKVIGEHLLDWMGFDSFEEFLNMLQFKTTAVVMGLVGVFKWFAGELSTLIDPIKGLFASFAEGFTSADLDSIPDSLLRIGTAIKSIVESLIGLSRIILESDLVQKVMEFLGWLSGNILVKGLQATAAILETIASLLKDLHEYLSERGLKGAFEDLGKWYKDAFDKGVFGGIMTGGAMGGYSSITPTPVNDAVITPSGDVFTGNNMLSGITEPHKSVNDAVITPSGDVFTGNNMLSGIPEPYKSVNDAIITPTGQVITTDPQDYIIATKDPQGLMPETPEVQNTIVNMLPPVPTVQKSIGEVSIQIDMSSMQLYVTQGDAEQAGRNLAEGLAEQIRDVLYQEQEALGA